RCERGGGGSGRAGARPPYRRGAQGQRGGRSAARASGVAGGRGVVRREHVGAGRGIETTLGGIGVARLRSGARNRRELAQAFGVGFVIGLAALALLMATHGQPGPLRRTSPGPRLPVVAEPSGRVPVQAGTIPERTVFRMKDPPGDDNGPGTYVYPTDETFVPGLFDLTDFAVRTAGDQVYFDLTFREVNNPWG